MRPLAVLLLVALLGCGSVIAPRSCHVRAVYLGRLIQMDSAGRLLKVDSLWSNPVQLADTVCAV